MTKYPYQVLTPEGSSYKEDVVFEISYLKSCYFSEKILFEFEIKMNSEYLKEMIVAGKAKMIMKFQSNIYATVTDISIICGKCMVEVASDKLQVNDTLKFVAYILANETMQLIYHNEMLDVYQGEYISTVRQKDVLAVSNTESLSYSVNNNEFIKFSVSEELNNKGYKIEPKENYINVVIGPEFNKAYGIIKNNKKDICVIFDSHLVFEVFVYVLLEIVQYYEECKGKEWYTLFEQIFLQCSGYADMESYKTDVMDGNCLDVSQIYDMAHKMINNQVENSLITVSKYEEA